MKKISINILFNNSVLNDIYIPLLVLFPHKDEILMGSYMRTFKVQVEIIDVCPVFVENIIQNAFFRVFGGRPDPKVSFKNI